MYIVRWLMGHPIIAIWVLGAIAILLTLGNGSKEGLVHQNGIQQEQSADLIEKEVDGSGSHSSNVPSIEKTTDAKHSLTNEDVASTANRGKTNIAVHGLKSENQPQKGLSVEKEIFVSKDGGQQKAKSYPSKKDAAELKGVTDLSQMSTEEMLLIAREAYWNNGLDEAAQIYSQLIVLEPEVLEHKGELGNVFWKQGFPKKAAKLYAEIAIPMIDKGDSNRVANMVGFIGLFYPDKADEIHKRIQLEQDKK